MNKRVLERQLRLFILILVIFWLLGFYWMGTLFFICAYTAQHDEDTLEEEAEYDDDALASYGGWDYDSNVEHHDAFLLKQLEILEKQKKQDKIKF